MVPCSYNCCMQTIQVPLRSSGGICNDCVCQRINARFGMRPAVEKKTIVWVWRLHWPRGDLSTKEIIGVFNFWEIPHVYNLCYLMAPTFIILGYFHFVSPTLLVPLPGLCRMDYHEDPWTWPNLEWARDPFEVTRARWLCCKLLARGISNMFYSCLMLQIRAVSSTEVLAKNRFGMEKCHWIAASNRLIVSSIPIVFIL